jgi:LmbE family N-acetylglucosaminyl deacetylase
MNDAVAVIAAHPDDEVLGCGGTIARLAKDGRPVHILLLADGVSSRGDAEIAETVPEDLVVRNKAAERACKILGCQSVQNLGLPDNRLDSLDLLHVVKVVENFIQKYRPSTVFTHHAGDVNIDHRVVHDAVIAACRPLPGHCVEELLFFEVPSSTEWRPPGSGPVFDPNWFVDIADVLDVKLKALDAYMDEMRPFPHPRSLVAVEALARWRGASAGFEAAEAFILGRKLIRAGENDAN